MHLHVFTYIYVCVFISQYGYTIGIVTRHFQIVIVLLHANCISRCRVTENMGYTQSQSIGLFSLFILLQIDFSFKSLPRSTSGVRRVIALNHQHEHSTILMQAYPCLYNRTLYIITSSFYLLKLLLFFLYIFIIVLLLYVY